MFPYIDLGIFMLPTYWLMGVLGAGACLLLLRKRCSAACTWVDLSNAAALGLIGVLVGGKLLYLITILPLLVQHWDFLRQNFEMLWQLVSAGFVYYGGLAGFCAVVAIYRRHYHLASAPLWNALAPAVPLFHAFGRIGCFLTGCCHGIVSEKYGIAFQHSPSAANGIPYFPVQLIESACEFVIFILLLKTEKKANAQARLMPLYLLCYGVCRFGLEFLRGDDVRGFLGPLSVSQWISLIVVLGSLLALRGHHTQTSNRQL